jgi:lysyl-tRNA synthetase, class II
MISGMVLEITGGYVIPYAADEGGEPVMIDFSPPWRRISMIEGLEEATGVKFPHMEDPGMAAFLEGICKKNNVICGAPRTVARLVDKLVGHFLEEDCMNPTFITDHPQEQARNDREIRIICVQTRGVQFVHRVEQSHGAETEIR